MARWLLFLCVSWCAACAEGSCTWSSCYNKAVSLVTSCSSGFEKKGGARDCGNPTCVFGKCAYTREEFQCCPGGDNCAWYDVSCNWDAISGYFKKSSPTLKSAWSTLSRTVQEKMGTGAKFSTLTNVELQSLGKELLAQAKGVAGMTAAQLSAVKDQVRDMDASDFNDFITTLSPSALGDGLADLTAQKKAWAKAAVEKTMAKLKSTDAWGDAQAWSTEKINALGSMASRVDLDTLKSFSKTQLAKASKFLAEMSASQINALWDKLGELAGPDFKAMLESVDYQQIYAAMLEQCDIKCSNAGDEAFLEDPSVANANVAMQEYAASVKSKMEAAGSAFVKSACAGNIEITQVDLRTKACNGTYSATGAMDRFQSWTQTQNDALITRLTNTAAMGSLENWGEDKLSSLCNTYASLNPSNIADLAVSKLIASAKDAALVAAFGPGAFLASFALAQAANSMSQEQRQAWAQKLKDGLGKVTSWTCAQVSSSQALIAGFDASDLAMIPAKAMRGVLPNSITAMAKEQVAGFTPEQIENLVMEARERLSAGLLSGLSALQRKAAVCGDEQLSGEDSCPHSVIDAVFRLPFAVEAADIIANFTRKESIKASAVKVLSIVPLDELPVKNTGRRLSVSGEAEATVRVSAANSDEASLITADAKVAADDLLERIGGSVISPPTAYGLQEDIITVDAALQPRLAMSVASALAVVCALG